MPRVYLLHGLPGTGKSTYARTLERDCGAVCLSHDEWMRELLGENPPQECFEKMRMRVEELIWNLAYKFVTHGVDVILDNGFWTRAARDEARRKALNIGAESVLVKMLCSPELADARVLARNNTLPKGTLYIDANALRVFRSRYEPLGEDEPHVEICGEQVSQPKPEEPDVSGPSLSADAETI